MLIKMLRGTVAAKKIRKPGDKVEVENAEGRYLVSIGKAEELKEAPKGAKKEEAPK